MKDKFIDFCEDYYNGVANFTARVLLATSGIIAVITVANIILHTT